MGKGKQRTLTLSRSPAAENVQQAKQGYSVWIWMVIGAAAGFAVRLALDLIGPMLGGQ